MLEDIPVNDDFPDGLRDAIGRVVIEFGRIEYLMKLCLKVVRGEGFHDGMAAAERAAGQFHRLCEALLTKAKVELTSDEFAALSDFVEEAKALASYRHDTVHAYWTQKAEHTIRYRPRWNRAEKKLEWRSRAVTVSELNEKADEMRRLHDHYDPVRRQWSVR